VRAKAVLPLQARNKLHHPKREFDSRSREGKHLSVALKVALHARHSLRRHLAPDRRTRQTRNAIATNRPFWRKGMVGHLPKHWRAPRNVA
jgi:hypothetical protein